VRPVEYIAPKTIAEACAVLAANPERTSCLAGGTDIIVQVRENRREVDCFLDIKHIPEVNQLSFDSQRGLRLGAAVPCYRIYEHPQIKMAYPGLIDAVSLVGGIQIQSRASVGGNLCNASPAADTIPPLIALEAVCVIASPNGMREVPVENFCIGPGKTVLQPGELLATLRIPPQNKHSGASYLRFIPRNEMDIAVVGVGVALTLDETRKRCTEARIALAAVAPTPILVPEAGAALLNGSITDALLEKAATLARAAARPISDMRGDADYRRHLVGVLVKRAVRMALERAQTG
jgi:carbon-monoxide dehydrogenase medium subunit